MVERTNHATKEVGLVGLAREQVNVASVGDRGYRGFLSVGVEVTCEEGQVSALLLLLGLRELNNCLSLTGTVTIPTAGVVRRVAIVVRRGVVAATRTTL